MKNNKWFKYTIDYEYGMATVISRERPEKPLDLFYNLAGDCFGIRKSIGKTKLIDEELVPFDGQEKSPPASGEQVMKMGGGDYTNTYLYMMVNRGSDIDIPQNKLEKTAFILAHDGDVIVFSKTEYDGGYWKLKSEHGDDWCVCKKEGKPELKCKVHHFWVKNHDKLCKEHK